MDKAKKKTNEERAIVKHSNQLAEIPLQNFTAKEINLFWGMLYRIQSQVALLDEIKDDQIIRASVTYNELRSVLGIERRGNEALRREIVKMSDKFSAINISTEHETGFSIVRPFTDFKGSHDKGTLTFGIHPDIARAMHKLDGSDEKKLYTLSDVVSISRMKSVFSKECLKMMFLYRNTGYWYVTSENLRYYLSIPEGYKANDVKRRVIDVIEEDFQSSGLFDEFEITPFFDETKKTAGRKKILGYTFSFRFSPEAPIFDRYRGADDVPSITCPKCGKPLVKKARKDGKGFFMGHLDGNKKGAECSYTQSIVDETEDKSAEAEKDYISEGDLGRYYRHLREKAIAAAEERKAEIRTKNPALWEKYLERENRVADFVSQISIFPGSEERKDAKKKVDEVNKELSDLLEAEGLDRDYLEVRYLCDKCKDTGMMDDGSVCSCKKERVKEAEEWLKNE